MPKPLLCAPCTKLAKEGGAECAWNFSEGCRYTIVACWHPMLATPTVWHYCLTHAANATTEFTLVRKEH